MSQRELSRIEKTGPVASEAQRVLVLGGILMIAFGMLFGDVFAMFVLHPNNARIGEAMFSASQLIPTGDAEAILAHFRAIGGYLENRGTKVDTHSHLIHMGYIALLLAMLQPWVALSDQARKRLAIMVVSSGTLMAASIFSIYYVGLAFSPLVHIGWGSIFADLFGALLAVSMFIYLWGFIRHVRGFGAVPPEPVYIGSGNAASRTLLIGGLLLLLAGFFYGAAYAGAKQLGMTGNEVNILKNIVTHAAASNQEALASDFADYGRYQMLRAINRATHTHINEMGILLLLMSFLQVCVHYSDDTRRLWARAAVCAGIGLPVGILLEIPYGIVGSVVADVSGFVMIVSLGAMLFGLLRYMGTTNDWQGGAA